MRKWLKNVKEWFEEHSDFLVTLATIALSIVGGFWVVVLGLFGLENGLSNECTDGVITAVFNEEAGTLTFSGNGAVGNTAKWMERFRIEERVQVRTIIFEDGITSIGSAEFSENQGYINLEKVIFRGDIVAIGSCAFSSNYHLRAVEFGGKCRVIEGLAFFQCVSLEEINVPEGCEVYSNVFSQTPLDNDESEEAFASPAPEMPPVSKEP